MFMCVVFKSIYSRLCMLFGLSNEWVACHDDGGWGERGMAISLINSAGGE